MYNNNIRIKYNWSTTQAIPYTYNESTGVIQIDEPTVPTLYIGIFADTLDSLGQTKNSNINLSG
jgi:hypothetical protein